MDRNGFYSENNNSLAKKSTFWLIVFKNFNYAVEEI